ncbi:MAG: HAMP domain-containing histidine kinase [Candidatus Eremiobacteraeota bacterium]|nr:HAMP domain-containing histidine kinase [Candidatus Eremiobacteraeota bacterium]MBV9055615.1 HAMP domain-containing histidine kinase [Candidatus Eremiobacteraeota bacterium]MBV9698940.1 HAMP domain-containing histidine kinase [Candidatus Eremiobacteraeota bacterium]
MGYRIPLASLTLRAAALYLGIFACVLAALSAGAYVFMRQEYSSILAPVLGTPEGRIGLASTMRSVLVTILAIDAPLIALVAVASYLLARATIAPLEAARERERLFAADAAHELRSPLTAISAIAQAARSGASPESARAFEAIIRSAFHASDVVGDLLTLARDPARGVLQCEPVDLAAIVAAAVADIEPIAGARDIRIESAAQSAVVDGDARRLRELARNLLDNAVRHARERVTIASQCNDATCELIVEDDGDGIAPAQRELVFERFYRRNDDASGTGLGLAIVRWIARAHEGSISIEEAPGGGARFVTAIPAYHA